MRARGFRETWEDAPNDDGPSVVMYHKFCHAAGCANRWQELLMGSDGLYQPVGLGLIYERVEANDCEHVPDAP